MLRDMRKTKNTSKQQQITTKQALQLSLYVLKVLTINQRSYNFQSKPHFLSPTLPRGSVVMCQKGGSCHLQTHFTNGDAFGLPNTWYGNFLLFPRTRLENLRLAFQE